MGGGARGQGALTRKGLAEWGEDNVDNEYKGVALIEGT